MFNVSVLAGLPFPSRQSFRVILPLELFQLMSKFTRYIFYIYKVVMFIVNILKILVLTCYFPNDL